MGIVNFGVPIEDVTYLQEKLSLAVAIEGGTYRGATAITLAELFARVYTIERSDVMYAAARERLQPYKNVTLLHGDTREHLPELVAAQPPALFWLDAHWSGAETYGEGDECPLMEELRIIFELGIPGCAILIDDARLFLAPPPAPHDTMKWPSVVDIAKILPSEVDLLVWDDVIYLTPTSIDFRSFVQDRVTAHWERASTERNSWAGGFARRIARILSAPW